MNKLQVLKDRNGKTVELGNIVELTRVPFFTEEWLHRREEQFRVVKVEDFFITLVGEDNKRFQIGRSKFAECVTFWSED